MIIAGEQEENTSTVTIRKKTGGDIRNISFDGFVEIISNAVENKNAAP